MRTLTLDFLWLLKVDFSVLVDLNVSVSGNIELPNFLEMENGN